MIRISHEAPNQIFDQVQKLTDLDYCLVNLYKENSTYRQLFLDAKASGREILLDNAVFELGEAWDIEEFIKVIEELQPTWYIIPDVLADYKGTIKAFEHFTNQYPNLPSKSIAVLQGKTYTELCQCYQLFLEYKVDKIAIPFHSPYYLSLYPDQDKLHAQMNGRRKFLWQLSREDWYSYSLPLHLLGISLPQEYIGYSNMPINIDSMDSSNPIVHGLKGIRYTDSGLETKENQKLFTMIDETVSEDQWVDIKFNIDRFKSFAQEGK